MMNRIAVLINTTLPTPRWVLILGHWVTFALYAILAVSIARADTSFGSLYIGDPTVGLGVVVIVALVSGFLVGTILTRPVAKAADDLAAGHWATQEVILSGLTDGVLVLDSARRVSYCNRAASALLNIDQSWVIGQNADELGEAFTPALWKLREALRHWPTWHPDPGDRLRFDVEIRGGDLQALEIELFRLGAEGRNTPGFVVLVRDVTSIAQITAFREREKVSMDLHDGIIQSLYALALGLSAKVRAATDRRDVTARDDLHQAIERVDDVIAEARQYILRLRRNQADDRGLRAQLQALATELEGHGLLRPQIKIDPGVAEAFGADATASLIQLIREAVSNAIRHSDATHVTVSVARAGDESVVITVADDGRGFAAVGTRVSNGSGVANMDERARKLGGTLVITSSPGLGTEIRVEIPFASRKLAG